jgi:hypothetical protein
VPTLPVAMANAIFQWLLATDYMNFSSEQARETAHEIEALSNRPRTRYLNKMHALSSSNSI